tara:strand:- start:2792 stop:3049 length:258 start_codon:yes stop_codon:yes gene_type:complete
MKKPKGIVTRTWLEARELIKTEQLEKAEQILDKGILLLTQSTIDGYGDKDLLEGVKMEVWKERFWVTTENYIWPTRLDYEKNWKF